MLRRTLFSILLLLAAFSLVGSVAMLGAQSFTTVTSFATVATQFTSTSATTIPIGTSYATSTQQVTLYSRTIKIDAPPPEHCNYLALPFSGKKGQLLSIQLTATVAVNFYVLTEDSYKTWQQGRYCRVGVPTLDSVRDTTSHTKQIALHIDGDYEFMFELFESNTPTEIQFNAEVGPFVTTAASTMVSESTTTFVFSSTQTSSYVRTQELAVPFSGQNILPIAAIIGIVIVVVAVLVLRMRSRKPPKGRSPKEEPTKIHCINCGAELPQGAKFCNKCGATQP